MRSLIWIFLFFVLAACSNKYLKHEDADKIKNIDEFEREVVITEPAPVPEEEPKVPEKSPPKKAKKEPTKKKATAKVTKAKKPAKPPRRQPTLEDSEGFEGRRPLVDPFHIGEEVTHSVRYFKVEAGTLKFKVEPFVEVNGRKSYSFVMEIESSRIFSNFYSVEDQVKTLVDYELMTPSAFTMHVKESGQLREARSYFDFNNNKAKYWEKKVTEKNGVEEKRQVWDIKPYSQNVFSSLFYMRTFQWKPGKEYAFRVADDEENLIFTAKAVRREEITTEAGKFKSIVIKPEIKVEGAFKPVGDIFIWLSDDDRKLVLRIESKIKIGTLVSEVTKVSLGKK